MRLRNIPGSQERILENKYTIQTDGADGADYRGKWAKEFFHNDHPVHIEVGMGKGKFILEMARQNPDINYIGIEKYSSVLVRALDHREELESDNLLFLRMDAEDIDQYFAPGEVAKIYLNFSDPWPKDRHAKRRLTSRQFLERYDRFWYRMEAFNLRQTTVLSLTSLWKRSRTPAGFWMNAALIYTQTARLQTML